MRRDDRVDVRRGGPCRGASGSSAVRRPSSRSRSSWRRPVSARLMGTPSNAPGTGSRRPIAHQPPSVARPSTASVPGARRRSRPASSRRGVTCGRVHADLQPGAAGVRPRVREPLARASPSTCGTTSKPVAEPRAGRAVERDDAPLGPAGRGLQSRVSRSAASASRAASQRRVGGVQPGLHTARPLGPWPRRARASVADTLRTVRRGITGRCPDPAYGSRNPGHLQRRVSSAVPYAAVRGRGPAGRAGAGGRRRPCAVRGRRPLPRA